MKRNAIISELFVPISVLLTGASLYLTLEVSFVFSPLVLLSSSLFGISCIGFDESLDYVKKSWYFKKMTAKRNETRNG